MKSVWENRESGEERIIQTFPCLNTGRGDETRRSRERHSRGRKWNSRVLFVDNEINVGESVTDEVMYYPES